MTAEKGSTVRVRDMSRVKLLKQRPEHLRRRGLQVQVVDSDDDDDYLDTKNLHTVPKLVQEEEDLEVDVQIQEQEQDVDQEQEQGAHHDQEQEQVGAHPKRIRKPSLRALESRAAANSKQPSPRQRRKAKATARQRSQEPEEIQDIPEMDFQEILDLDE